VKALADYLQTRLTGQAGTPPRGMQLNASFTQLNTSGWEGVTATQALTHMPLEEAQALARVYAQTRAFNELEAKAESHWFDLAALPADDPSAPRPREELVQEAASVKLSLAYQKAIAEGGPSVLAGYDRALKVLGR
jgi:2-polyprenyl-6-methoxyphenol hydroxylase-like FAD-dependent oxidoreductase